MDFDQKRGIRLSTVIITAVTVMLLTALVTFVITSRYYSKLPQSAVKPTATTEQTPAPKQTPVPELSVPKATDKGTARPEVSAPWQTAAPENSQSLKNNFVAIGEKYGAAVVSVYMYKGDSEASKTLYSQGSGFIIDNRGYIVTNSHVASGGNFASVTLSDGTSLKAEILGYDARTEVGVLKIAGNSSLTTVILGDSDKLKVGEYAIAMGTPLGYEGSLSVGVISGVNRIIDSNGLKYKMIQTDTAINSGSSGGPLFNANGEVIGINTIKQVYTGGGIPVDGMGFAVPINTAKEIIESLINTGKVSRPALNIIGGTLYGENGAECGIGVSEVVENGAADKAGMLVGDVIIAVDGVTVNSMSALIEQLDAHKTGDKVTIEIERNEKNITLQVVLGTS